MRTEILDEELLRGRDVRILEHYGIPVLERLPRRGVEQPDAVVVREAALPRDGNLYAVDGRVLRHLDRLREPPDGALGRYGFVSGARGQLGDGGVVWDVQRFLRVRVVAMLTVCVSSGKWCCTSFAIGVELSKFMGVLGKWLRMDGASRVT